MTQTFVKTGQKNPENCNVGVCDSPLLNSLFSESHLVTRDDNHPSRVSGKHGKRELKGKGGAPFL